MLHTFCSRLLSRCAPALELLLGVSLNALYYTDVLNVMPHSIATYLILPERCMTHISARMRWGHPAQTGP